MLLQAQEEDVSNWTAASPILFLPQLCASRSAPCEASRAIHAYLITSDESEPSWLEPWLELKDF